MAIRAEALECKEFCQLLDIYNNRKAALTALKQEGKKVACLVGYDIPDEIVLAAGMVPFRITGYYGGERKAAEKYLEYSFGAIWKGLFETVAEDYAGLMDYAVFSSSSDMFLKLFYYFRTLKRLEPQRPLPEMKYLDFELVQKSFKSQERNERELQDLVEQLETWSGNKVTKQALSDAIKLCNRYRAALEAFSALRKTSAPTVTGSEALVVIGGSMFMDKEQAIAAIQAVSAAAENWPEVEATKVYYVGSPHEITEFYQLAEDCGLNIVGEDHDMGDRMFDTLVDEALEPISAIASRILLRMPSSEKGGVDERARWIGEKLEKSGADCLLTYMNVNDEAYVWDYPTLKNEVLDKRGIPSDTVQKQTWPLNNVEALKEQLRSLAAAGKEAGNG